MLLLDLSLATAAENLALDEALLDDVDDQPHAPELLRLWECPEYAVVLGRSCQVAAEVNRVFCETDNVPILRRTSGGGTVLIGPGCLMYSLRLSYEQRPHLRLLDQAHREVLQTTATAINGLFSQAESMMVKPRGTSDLAQGERKVSGNSLRCKRNFLLYHGTLLYDFDLSRVERYLRPPPREPAYRVSRPHREFVANLPLESSRIKASLIDAWQATHSETWPRELTQQLVEQRYHKREWNMER